MSVKNLFRPFYNCCKIIKFSKNNKVTTGCRFSRETVLEGCNIIKKSDITSSYIGFGSSIQEHSFLPHTKIGKFSSIGKNVTAIFWKHPTDKISTYPGTYKSVSGSLFKCEKQYKFNEKDSLSSGYNIEIGNDVWIGSNVLLKGGIKIGDGAIIAMGAVVVEDVPPFAIVGGVPAKVIKYRFPEDEIKLIISDPWWNKPIKEIEKFDFNFSSYKEFLNVNFTEKGEK